MAEVDWLALSGNLDAEEVSWGKTTATEYGIIDGTAAVGFHSLKPSVGFSGFVLNVATFNPIANHKGARIIALVKKHAPMTGGAPVLFLSGGMDARASEGYRLGLSEEWPYKIILAKGPLSDGLSEESDFLAVSNAAYDVADWFRLSLEVCVNTQNDLVITALAYKGGLSTPQPIPGIDSYVDDSLGRNSGTQPLFGDFYVGFGHYNSGQAGRVSLFDHIEVIRQLTP